MLVSDWFTCHVLQNDSTKSSPNFDTSQVPGFPNELQLSTSFHFFLYLWWPTHCANSYAKLPSIPDAEVPVGYGPGGQGGGLEAHVARDGGGEGQKGHEQSVPLQAHQLFQVL